MENQDPKEAPKRGRPKLNQAPAPVKRVYKEDMMIDSDTFKLEVANYAKNLSIDDSKPVITGVEHCHFYHTYDSSGKRMTQANAVGGHTHDVEVRVDEHGNMYAICGPAKSNKKIEDNHTHEVTYVKSDRFKVRTMNPQAQQAIVNYEKMP